VKGRREVKARSEGGNRRGETKGRREVKMRIEGGK
jgi:hypothetical protein